MGQDDGVGHDGAGLGDDVGVGGVGGQLIHVLVLEGVVLQLLEELGRESARTFRWAVYSRVILLYF